MVKIKAYQNQHFQDQNLIHLYYSKTVMLSRNHILSKEALT